MPPHRSIAASASWRTAIARMQSRGPLWSRKGCRARVGPEQIAQDHDRRTWAEQVADRKNARPPEDCGIGTKFVRDKPVNDLKKPLKHHRPPIIVSNRTQALPPAIAAVVFAGGALDISRIRAARHPPRSGTVGRLRDVRCTMSRHDLKSEPGVALGDSRIFDEVCHHAIFGQPTATNRASASSPTGPERWPRDCRSG